jgi:hypothetical protein
LKKNASPFVITSAAIYPKMQVTSRKNGIVRLLINNVVEITYD